jgi:hypothetical protein
MALLVEESSCGIGRECGDTMKTPPNKVRGPNRRPARQFAAVVSISSGAFMRGGRSSLDVSPIPHMNRFTTILLLSVSVFLMGCAAPNVKYSDLSPATTASVSGGTVTVHLGSDLMNSAYFTRAKARVEGQTVCIAGYHTLREQSRDFAVRLPASTSPQPVSVFWLDPDGSRVPVPIKK